MNRKQIPFHVERSIYVVSRIRHEKSLNSSEFTARVRLAYAECNALSHAPKEETLRGFVHGRNPIPFLTEDPKVPSYLMAIELAFPDSQTYFFHPVFNLLVGPVWINTPSQLKRLKIPISMIEVHRKRGHLEMAEACEQYNQELSAKQRRKQANEVRPTTLQWVHGAMYAIDEPVRSLLFTRGGLGVNRRRYSAVEDEVAELVRINSLDALAGMLGLFLEGREIDDLTRVCVAKDGARRLLEGLRGDPTLRKVLPALTAAVLTRVEDTSIRGVNFRDAMDAHYPRTYFEFSRVKDWGSTNL